MLHDDKQDGNQTDEVKRDDALFLHGQSLC
jgi:hypothetical protein